MSDADKVIHEVAEETLPRLAARMVQEGILLSGRAGIVAGALRLMPDSHERTAPVPESEHVDHIEATVREGWDHEPPAKAIRALAVELWRLLQECDFVCQQADGRFVVDIFQEYGREVLDKVLNDAALELARAISELERPLLILGMSFSPAWCLGQIERLHETDCRAAGRAMVMATAGIEAALRVGIDTARAEIGDGDGDDSDAEPGP